MALPLRVLPLSGTEANRQSKASSILDDEIHSTRDQERLFLKNRLVGPVWHGTVANETAMTGLNSSSSRGCWPGDKCARTDTATIWECISNNGTSPSDWYEFPIGSPGSGGDAADVAYDNGTSGLTADNVQDAIDEIVAGGGGSGSGAMELIQEIEVTTPVATITFSSIPGTYRHLKLMGLGALSATPDWIAIRFNGDTGNNYDWQVVRFTNNTVSAGGSAAASFLVVGEPPNSASVPGVFETTIFEYASSVWHKLIRGQTMTVYGTAVTDLHPRATAGRWRSTSAITSITILSDVAGNFRTGSRFQLYGVKA